ncbi:MAG TPA: hypothetical protein VNY51_14370 [Candidatus Dormibacteraeota bacterium]|nr:hypothetical protein [Candidatus Dormibacteraeota bacterium]
MIAVKERGLRLAMTGGMTEELMKEQVAQERETIQAFTDHTAEHGCREPGD